MNIDGRASVKRSAPEALGDGWTAYGGDVGGHRYSSASAITEENVQQLAIAWQYRTRTFEGRESVKHRTAFQGTPILAAGSLLLCTPFNEVIALDPATGREKWRFDPQVDISVNPANSFTCRGLAFWQDPIKNSEQNCAARIFMGTVDARLIALDAHSGKPCSDFGNAGSVQIQPGMSLRWPGEFQISSAPAIVGNVVVTGSAISDNLRSDAPLGTVQAFDTRTGIAIWKFNPVPRDPDDPARASWADDSADRTGHANVWSSMTVDEKRDLVFLPTSSPSPDFYGGARVGDNHYANSVVALRGKTGQVAWSFQTVHHDVWDYDVPAQPGLYQVWRDGRAHDVVAQATKTGLLFVLDRDAGKPFLPVEERPVPQGGVAGEVLSPTQPFPVDTPPIVPSSFNANDAFGLTLWDRYACIRKVKSLRAEGLFTPPSTEGTMVYPFTGGGANWGGAAFDPTRNLLVVNMSNAAHRIQLHPGVEKSSGVPQLGHDAEFAPMEGVPYAMTRELLASPLGLPCSPPPWGVLAAIDLANGKIVWRKIIGTTEDLAPGGLSLTFGTPNFGGPIITAGGLIFIAAAMDNYIRAFNVATGTELWKARLPAGGQATPMSYQWNNRQYVVIAAGGHDKSQTSPGDYLVAFALPE
ncbi:MAG: pyrroloquinoline quinone-dependent dehydrogenase [Gammaproteobacteria bacterium]|nr:pyrroloquinoline quinone-dependent dehydrogenase [Gammaproteobacteria bacterium]